MGEKVMLCDYGCGQEAKYPFKNGKWCCSKSVNSCPKIREKHKESAKSTFKKGHTPWNKENREYLTDELRSRMGEKNIGRDAWNKDKTGIYSEKTLKLMSESKKGEPPWNKGLKNCYSIKTILKMSKSHEGYKPSQETIQKMSNSAKKENLSIETLKKRSDAAKNRKFTKETRLKLSESKKGKKNPMFGKKIKFSSNHKMKLRVAAIKRIENRCGQCAPNYNPVGCKLIEEYGKTNGYNFQHAENGGEFYIKELGYWVDGYDKEKNVVLEIDESFHFDNDGNLIRKDIKRQKEIEDFLNCKFIRIRI